MNWGRLLLAVVVLGVVVWAGHLLLKSLFGAICVGAVVLAAAQR